jgi:hypothetical protein
MVVTIEASNWCKIAPSLHKNPDSDSAHRNTKAVKKTLTPALRSSKMPPRRIFLVSVAQ